jgi:hypothetical protein
VDIHTDVRIRGLKERVRNPLHSVPIRIAREGTIDVSVIEWPALDALFRPQGIHHWKEVHGALWWLNTQGSDEEVDCMHAVELIAMKPGHDRH